MHQIIPVCAFVTVCVCDRNGAKLLVGAGAVYVTVNEGVWSTSESGLCAAQRLRTYVLPETTQYWDKVISCFLYNSRCILCITRKLRTVFSAAELGILLGFWHIQC